MGLLDTTRGVLNAKGTRQNESQVVVVQDHQSIGGLGEGCTHHSGLPGGLGGKLLTGSLSCDTREHVNICCGR